MGLYVFNNSRLFSGVLITRKNRVWACTFPYRPKRLLWVVFSLETVVAMHLRPAVHLRGKTTFPYPSSPINTHMHIPPPAPDTHTFCLSLCLSLSSAVFTMNSLEMNSLPFWYFLISCLSVLISDRRLPDSIQDVYLP